MIHKTALSQSEIAAVVEKLVNNGLTDERLALVAKATPEQLQTLIDAFPKSEPSTKEKAVVYSAEKVSRILGLDCPLVDPVPDAGDCDILVYYGGWNLEQLANSLAGKRFFTKSEPSDYNKEDFLKPEAGYYRIFLAVEGVKELIERKMQKVLDDFDTSNVTIWDLCMAALKEAAPSHLRPVPMLILMTALLAHVMDTYPHEFGSEDMENFICAESEGNSLLEMCIYFNQIDDFTQPIDLLLDWDNEEYSSSSGDIVLYQKV